MKIYLITFILALFFILTTAQVVFAESPSPAPSSAATSGGILQDIKNAKQDDALKKADNSTKKVVQAAQGFGILGAIVMICWIGYTLGLQGGNANALAQMKTKIVFFLLGLYVAFFPVEVLGMIFGVFGYSFNAPV